MSLASPPTRHQPGSNLTRTLSRSSPCISTTKRHRTIVWIFRGVAAVGLVLALVFVSINFFAEDAADACEWCRYLSCVPVKQTNFVRLIFRSLCAGVRD